MSIPRYVGVGVAALVVIGGGWFAVTAYGLSVRYGTADPCEMIATSDHRRTGGFNRGRG